MLFRTSLAITGLVLVSSFAVVAQDAVMLKKTTYTYKIIGDTKIEADVYRSANPKARPVLVWIHGGALIVGHRDSVPKQLLDLAKQEDYALVSIDYRLGPEAKLPAIADDVRDAIAWI